MRRGLLLILFLCIGSRGLSGLEVRLLESARVSGAEVTLGEIASLDGEGGEGLRGLVVVRLAEHELTRVLQYAEILDVVRGVHAGPLYLVGSSVRINRISVSIGREAMLARIRTVLQAKNPEAVLDLDPGLLPATREFPGPPVHMEVMGFESVLQSGPWKGRLVFTRDGRELGSLELHGRIRIPGRVLVAAMACFRGTVLRPEDVRFQPVDDVGDPGSYLSLLDVKGRRLLTDIEEGARITPDHLEKPLVVRRGMRLDVVWTGNGVRIEVPSEALEDGRVGDVIRLRNPHTAREFRAVIREERGKVYADG